VLIKTPKPGVRETGSSSIFARAQSAAYFERIRPLFENRTLVGLKADVTKLEADPSRLPQWVLSRLTPSQCIGMKHLATRP
ncbi:MAG: hypothetical protein WCI94_23565, partial [Rhodospirillales bacterium]